MLSASQIDHETCVSRQNPRLGNLFSCSWWRLSTPSKWCLRLWVRWGSPFERVPWSFSLQHGVQAVLVLPKLFFILHLYLGRWSRDHLVFKLSKLFYEQHHACMINAKAETQFLPEVCQDVWLNYVELGFCRIDIPTNQPLRVFSISYISDDDEKHSGITRLAEEAVRSDCFLPFRRVQEVFWNYPNGLRFSIWVNCIVKIPLVLIHWNVMHWFDMNGIDEQPAISCAKVGRAQHWCGKGTTRALAASCHSKPTKSVGGNICWGLCGNIYWLSQCWTFKLFGLFWSFLHIW